MYCKKCGCELEENSKFCNKCGAKLFKDRSLRTNKFKKIFDNKIVKSIKSFFKKIFMTTSTFTFN